MKYFLTLTFLEGILEVGPMFLALIDGYSLSIVLLFPLAYQFGNLFPVPFRLSRNMLAIGCCLAVAAFALYICAYHPTISLLLCIFSSSAVLQSVRSVHKAECKTIIKRILHVSGFLVSSLFVFIPEIFLMAILIISAAGIFTYPWKTTKLSGIRKPDFQQIAMFFHQMHYFVYTYGLPVLATVISRSFLVGIGCFFISWWPYLLLEKFTKKILVKIGYVKYFFFCHSLLLLILCGLSAALFYQMYWLSLVLWFITGVGGGSVFCINQLCGKEEKCPLAENLGHVGGIVVAIAISMLSGHILTLICAKLTGISSCFVFLTLIFAAFACRRRINHDKQD